LLPQLLLLSDSVFLLAVLKENLEDLALFGVRQLVKGLGTPPVCELEVEARALDEVRQHVEVTLRGCQMAQSAFVVVTLVEVSADLHKEAQLSHVAISSDGAKQLS
jgi:hypothetical protein